MALISIKSKQVIKMCSVVIFHCSDRNARKVAIYLFLFTSKMFASRDQLVDTTQSEGGYACCRLSAEFLSTEFGMQLLPSASQAPWCGR